MTDSDRQDSKPKVPTRESVERHSTTRASDFMLYRDAIALLAEVERLQGGGMGSNILIEDKARLQQENARLRERVEELESGIVERLSDDMISNLEKHNDD